MLQIIARIREWLKRRRSFSEEWAFHRERAAIELESLGLDRQEAEEMAAARMSRRSRYRREALHSAEADLAGLVQLLLPERSLHTAWILPLSLAAALGLLYAVNLGRQPVWQTVTGSNFAAEVAPTRATSRPSAARPNSSASGSWQ